MDSHSASRVVGTGSMRPFVESLGPSREVQAFPTKYRISTDHPSLHPAVLPRLAIADAFSMSPEAKARPTQNVTHSVNNPRTVRIQRWHFAVSALASTSTQPPPWIAEELALARQERQGGHGLSDRDSKDLDQFIAFLQDLIVRYGDPKRTIVQRVLQGGKVPSEPVSSLLTNYLDFKSEVRRAKDASPRERAVRIIGWAQKQSDLFYRPDDHNRRSIWDRLFSGQNEGLTVGENWPTLAEVLARGYDDCDGLDLLAYDLLQSCGVGPLYRAVIRKSGIFGGDHMVTLWCEDLEDPWVIDSTGAATGELKRLSEIQDWTLLNYFDETEQFLPPYPGAPFTQFALLS